MAFAVAVVAAPLAARPQQTLSSQGPLYAIFARGVPVGTEQIATTSTTEGWTVVSTGRANAPVNIVLRRLELKYDSNWKPLEMSVNAVVRTQEQRFRTVRHG